jgi:hypothetical protein
VHVVLERALGQVIPQGPRSCLSRAR